MEDTIHTLPLRERDERFMASRRKRWPYWFKPHIKLKLMGGKWRHPVSSGFNGASVLMQMAWLFVSTSSSLQLPTMLHTSSHPHKHEEAKFLLNTFPFWRDRLRCESCRKRLTLGGLSGDVARGCTPSLTELANLNMGEVRVGGKEQRVIGSHQALAFHRKGKKKS